MEGQSLGLERIATSNASLERKVDRLIAQQDDMMQTLILMLREKEDEKQRDEERRELQALLAERDRERELGELTPLLPRDSLFLPFLLYWMLIDHHQPERHQQNASCIITSPRPPVASMPSTTLSMKESRIVRGEAASDSSEISGARRGREGRNGADKGREMNYSDGGDRPAVWERIRGNEERRWKDEESYGREQEMSRDWERQQEARRRDSESGSAGETPTRRGGGGQDRDRAYRSTRGSEFGDAPSLSQGEREHWSSRDHQGVAPLW